MQEGQAGRVLVLGERRQEAANDLRRLQSAPAVELGSWPTPIEALELACGRPLFVKRDDLSGFGRGGAKARKISHVLGHLVAGGHGELVAAAGNVTNLAFDLVPALDAQGIRSKLFILNDPPLAPTARAQIFHGIHSRVELVGSSHAGLLVAALAAYRASRAEGRRPFIALPGLSHPAAVVGNACGVIEMAEQMLARGERLPDAIFVTAATGTTLAGFLIAANILAGLGHGSMRVVGAQIYGGAIARRTRMLVRWTERACGLAGAVPESDIRISSAELAGGFARFGANLVELCERVRAEHGLPIDPIFGGKTWAVLEAFTERGAYRRPMYWHCGYTPEWRLLGGFMESAAREAA